MLRLSLLSLTLLLFIITRSQNLDSLLSAPQHLKLIVSTPQPRYNETFSISVDFNHIRANIFKSLIGKLELSDDINYHNTDEINLNVTATKKGKMEIGPLKFTVNGTQYTTNKSTITVIDPLPNTNEGLWFRKVPIEDDKVCIIIEQRIPARETKTVTSDNSFTLATEPEYNNIAKFKDSYSITGLSSITSNIRTDFGSIIGSEGNILQFQSVYSVYYFQIKDKEASIRITKDVFENIPPGYDFEDIVIQ